jgi:hypothetical protein
MPFGKYSRTIRFRFSLLPRCQGLCGYAKKTVARPEEPQEIALHAGQDPGEQIVDRLPAGTSHPR